MLSIHKEHYDFNRVMIISRWRQHGVWQRDIANQLGLSGDTVKKYFVQDAGEVRYIVQLSKPARIDPYKRFFQEKMAFTAGLA